MDCVSATYLLTDVNQIAKGDGQCCSGELAQYGDQVDEDVGDCEGSPSDR